MNLELEKIIGKFLEGNNHHSLPGELHSFVQTFLQPTEENTELKKFMFLNLIGKIPELFAILTNDKNGADNNEAIGCENEIKTSNLQGATLCLKTLHLCLMHSETHGQLESLFNTAISVLIQSYTHCKESEKLYGDLLEDFTDQLANFFKEIQIVQTALLSAFDHLLSLQLSESKVNALVSVSEDFGNLCELVVSLDTVLSAKLWRQFIKLVTKYPEPSRRKVKVDSILSTLVSVITGMVDEYIFKLENEEQVEESENKIFLFLINLVMKFFHLFHDCIKEGFQNIVKLALKLYKILILSYSPMVSDDINTSQLKIEVVNTVKPIIPLFYCNGSFLTAVLQLNAKELSPDLHMAHVLLKLSALGSLLSDKNYIHMNKNEDNFIKVMLTLQANKPNDDILLTSIKIPLSLFQISESLEKNNEELVTMYHHVCSRLSEYSRIISDSNFKKIGNHMLDLLVSSTELVSLLISDVWIYRLRCSSTEYLYTTVIDLLQSVSQFHSNAKYKEILKRMLKFLPSDVLMGLFEEFSELEHLICNRHKVLHRYSIPELISSKVRKESSDVLQKISLLMNELKSPILDDAQLVPKACCILELSSLFVNMMQSREIFMFTEIARYLFKSEIFDVQIAVLTFLKAFNGKNLLNEATEVTNALASLLAETLQSTNYIVKYEALNTYAYLAQSPTLIKVCKQTVIIAPNLTADIKSYFTKIPLAGFLTEKERMHILEKQLHSVAKQPEIVSEETKKLLLPLKSI